MNIYQKNILAYFILISSPLLSCRHEEDGIIEIKTQTELQNLLTNSHAPLVVFLSMKNCGWCTKMHSIVDDVACDKRFQAIAFYTADGHNLKAQYSEKSVATQDIVKNTTGENIPGYPFILFMNKGKFIDKQIGGTVLTKEQKTKAVTDKEKFSAEKQVFAEKIMALFPNLITPKTVTTTNCNCN